MTLLLIIAVTWVTITLVTVGVCAVAGRADRVAAGQAFAALPSDYPARPLRPDAPFDGVSTRYGRTAACGGRRTRSATRTRGRHGSISQH